MSTEQHVTKSAETGQYVDGDTANKATSYETDEAHLSPWRKEANRLLDEIELGAKNGDIRYMDCYTVDLVIHCQVLKRP